MPKYLIGKPRVCPYLFPVATMYRMPKLTTRREFFRLPYPVSSGATLAFDGANYTVGEISEGGLRINGNAGRFAVESSVQGTLLLNSGSRCPVIGTLLRVEERCVIVKLSRGPSSQEVFREQRHLSKAFPDWKPQPA